MAAKTLKIGKLKNNYKSEALKRNQIHENIIIATQ